MADQQLVRKAISVLISAYPKVNQTDQDAMNQYLILLENFLIQYPNELIHALASPRTGIIAECSFFPAIADVKKFLDREFAALAQRRIAEEREEARKLHAPDLNPAVSKETQTRVAGMFKNLVRELAHADGKTADEPLLTREEYQAKLEASLDRIAQEAKVVPPPKLSDELRRRMGLITN